MSEHSVEILTCPHCGFSGMPEKQTFGSEISFICPRCHGFMKQNEPKKEAAQSAKPEGSAEKALADSKDGEYTRLLAPLVNRIYIVDDSKLMLKVLSDGIKWSNMARNVETMSSGEDCLMRYTRAYKEGNMPDMIILDASLPVIPGTAVAVAIRSMEKAAKSPFKAPIIFLTVQPASVIKPTIDYIKKAVYLPKLGTEANNLLISRLTNAANELLRQSA